MNQLCKRITCAKITRQLKENDKYITALNQHKLANTLDTEPAQRIYTAYTKLQAVLIKRLPANIVPTFHTTLYTAPCAPISIPQQDSQLSCNICNFPITSLLTTHHVIPKSKGGKFGPTVKLCATCHTMIHKCANGGTIDEGIYAYYAPIDGAIEKIEMYINNINGS